VRLLPWLLVGVLWLLGFPALRQYNVTWDEALGDFFFGERYFSYFTSFDAKYLDFATDAYPPERQPSLYSSPFKGRPWEYYPLANTLAGATSELLARQLHLLDVYDGFHAVNLLLAAVLIVAMFREVARRDGVTAALAAIVLLFTAPRVFCDLMANIKDFPLLVFFTLSVLLFFRAWETGSRRGLLVAAAVVGLGLATKGNTLFFPLVPGLLWLWGGTPPAWQGRRKELVNSGALAALVAFAVLFAVWPYLWTETWPRLSKHVTYISLRAAYLEMTEIDSGSVVLRAESAAPATEALLLTTPPVFLLAALAGALLALRQAIRTRDRWAILLLVWPLAVFLRYLLPGAINFDGVRHFLELFPPLAILAGRAIAELARRLAAKAGDASALRRALPAAAALLLLLPGAAVTWASHPFQIAYWNVFAGGFKGARADNQPQVGDYWGMSYRQGLEWLWQNAEPNALVAVPVVEHAVRLVAPLRLRPDLQLLPVSRPTSPYIHPDRLEATRDLARKGATIYVMFVERRDWVNQLMIDCLTYLEPIAVWTYEGEPVLSIYRYRPPPDVLAP
jgi:hypothetical protein